MTAISVGELSYGAQKSARPAKNLARLDVLLAQLVILPFTEGAGWRFGALKARLESLGQRLDDSDLQIGCTVLDKGVPLLTHNRRHFDRIPGLQIEDWLEAP